jgi:hypothetical protein
MIKLLVQKSRILRYVLLNMIRDYFMGIYYCDGSWAGCRWLSLWLSLSLRTGSKCPVPSVEGMETTELGKSATRAERSRPGGLVLTALTLGFAVVQLDVSVVNVAVKAIGTGLGGGLLADRAVRGRDAACS